MELNMIERLRMENSPLLNGREATFVYQGQQPPRLAGDFNGWSEQAVTGWEKAGTALWVCRLEFPADAYIEYAFFQGEERLLDAFNPRLVSNGMGNYNNFFYMPENSASILVKRKRGVSRGTLTRHVVHSEHLLRGKRNLRLYQPPTRGRVPLVVVYDGQDYQKRAMLPMIVDNLIAQGKIQPIALAMLDHAGQAHRGDEYLCTPATLEALTRDVLPLAQKELNLVDLEQNPGAFGVMGASLGGLMALYTGLRLPHIFGKVLSQSGAMRWQGEYLIDITLLGEVRKYPLNVWLDVGLYDLPGLLAANRDLRVLLNQHAIPNGYLEYAAGHNYTAWRNNLWQGLEYLFAKP